MKSNMQILPGFIVFEGIDGAGTSTQSRLLYDRLIKEKKNTKLTCEPTDNPVGRLIRTLLRGEDPVPSETFAYLFAADRHDHLYNTDYGIQGQAKNSIVISDRYFYSSLAYQSIGGNRDLVYSLNSPFPRPELLIFIEIDPKLAEARRRHRDFMDITEAPKIQQECHNNYLKIIEEEKNKGTSILHLNGSTDIETIHDLIWSSSLFQPIFKR